MSRSPSRLDMRGPSSKSSPQLFFSENSRMSATSTSSSYSQVSTTADAKQGLHLALPSLAYLRTASELTAELQDEHTEHSDPDEQRRIRKGEAAKNYVCTYCNKDFGGKSDWKRHETTFHEPQYTWECPVCNRTFNSKRKFSTHHDRDHDCLECDHGTEAQKSLPAKAAFGCGFQSCNQVLYSWDDRCNHVAKHFEDGEIKPNWQYSTMIKNLLRQDRLDAAWKRLMGELHGPREFWPNLIWRQEDTKDIRERLEYSTFGDITDLLHTVHRTGIANATARPEIPTLPSPALRPEAEGLVNLFSDNDSLVRQTQIDALRVGSATVSPGHPPLGAEIYPGNLTDMQYYQTQTVTPPSDMAGATSSYHGLSPPGHSSVYGQVPYPSGVGYHTTYTLDQPSPYPPVPSNSILASDQFYSTRPIAQAQRSPLPPHAQHSRSPVPSTPPQHEGPRARATSRQCLGKRTFGSSSRKESDSPSPPPSFVDRRDQPSQHSLSPLSDVMDFAYLPAAYHPDSFL